jgi:hypothetical protein
VRTILITLSLLIICQSALSEHTDILDLSIQESVRLEFSFDLEQNLTWKEKVSRDIYLHTVKQLKAMQEMPFIKIYENKSAPYSSVKGYRNGKLSKNVPVLKLSIPPVDAFLGNSNVYTLHWDQVMSEAKKDDFFRLRTVRSSKDLLQLPVYTVPMSDSLVAYDLVVKHPIDSEIKFKVHECWKGLEIETTKPEPGVTALHIAGIRGSKDLGYHGVDHNFAEISVEISANEIVYLPKDAASFTEWYKNYADLKPVLNSDLPATLAKELAGQDDDLGKLRVINSWVATNCRYISDVRDFRGLTPEKPDKTLETLFGDCKAKSALVSAIARTQNIDAYLALMHTEDQALTTLSAGAFNHMIIAWQNDGKWLLGDPTDPGNTFGLHKTSYHGHPVLILDPDNPVLIEYDASLDQANFLVEIHAHIDSLDKAVASLTLSNDYASQANWVQKNRSELQTSNWLSAFVGDFFKSVGLQSFKLTEQETIKSVFSADADISALIVRGRKGDYLQKYPIFGFSKAAKKRLKDDEVFVKLNPFFISIRIKLDYPGLTDMNEEYGTAVDAKSYYKGNAANEGETLIFENTFCLEAGEFKEQRLKKVKELIKVMNSDRNAYVKILTSNP